MSFTAWKQEERNRQRDKETEKIVNMTSGDFLIVVANKSLNQRPDHYTYQVSVYLPSISILIIILSILIFKY